MNAKLSILAAIAAVFLTAPPAFAQTTATGTGNANSASSSGAIAVGGSSGATAGASNSLIFNQPGTVNSTIRYRQSGSLKTTPGVAAPGLGAAGVETCFGPGVSGGVSVTGFGASFGAGQYDSSCNRRLNSRTLWSMGLKHEAIIVMSNEPEVMAAMQRTGLVTLGPGDPGYQPRMARGVVYSNAGAQGTRSRAAAFQAGCTRWTGGSPGAGVCVY